ncbi:MAG: hypothetical protein SGJ20_09230 [Planctomycetota bacterium]|nr:hypothetical protein [Planctomycetota bacterium]
MSKRWVGVVVSSDKVVIVDAEVPDAEALQIQMDTTWPLQDGDRSRAYVVMADRLESYLRENKIEKVAVKASALSMGSTKMGHLEACELRGVVMCAASRVAKVELIAKAHTSKTFGKRKVDEYLKDDGFWADEVTGKLRSGSREAGMALLALRKRL